jgi:hypothetical protein
MALWMVRFIATHLATARDTLARGDTEFEKRCFTTHLEEGNKMKNESWNFNRIQAPS